MVQNLLGMVAGGYSVERIVAVYPEIASEDVAAALEYAAAVVNDERVIPV